MASYPSLSTWVDDVNVNNRKAAYRAINKAVSKTNTQFKRALQKATGLKSKDISPRLMQRKASMNSLAAYVSVGTKFGIPLMLFKPKVKLVAKNRKRGARKYNGVTVSVPGQGRYLVDKGFMMTTKSGKTLIAKRRSGARLPVNEQKFQLSETALSKQQEMNSYMREEFKAQFSEQLKYLTQK